MASTNVATRATGPTQSSQAQLEHLQMKFVGTGHPDTTKYEWITNQHRDSIASFVGHSSMLHYFAMADGESVGRMRFNLLQDLLCPCGVPPAPKDKEAAKTKLQI